MNLQTVQTYLNMPISRKKALAAVLAANTAMVATYLSCKELLKQADEIIADQKQRLSIYHESLDFLLDRADDSTILVLNENLDFWRVIRKQPPPEDKQQ